MDKKICVITGSNSGIGQAAAVQIAQAGGHVINPPFRPAGGILRPVMPKSKDSSMPRSDRERQRFFIITAVPVQHTLLTLAAGFSGLSK